MPVVLWIDIECDCGYACLLAIILTSLVNHKAATGLTALLLVSEQTKGITPEGLAFMHLVDRPVDKQQCS